MALSDTIAQLWQSLRENATQTLTSWIPRLRDAPRDIHPEGRESAPSASSKPGAVEQYKA